MAIEGVDARGIGAFLDAIESDPRIEPHGLIIQRHGRRIAEGHRTLPPTHNSTTPRAGALASPPAPAAAAGVAPRSLAIYEAIGRRLAAAEPAR